jgi:leucyl/phenylalanyl-tRNA--protein transferase
VSAFVWLSERDPPQAFPPVEQALKEPDGLLAAGGDLSAPRILAAYRRGIFPWYSPGQPILWWSPDPRAVVFPGELWVSRSLAKSLRNRSYRTTVDAAFARVIAQCASESLRPEGTWISPEMSRAYACLHGLGLAHSIETWVGTELVGGLYGVALGRVFFGESMFARARDASKVALVALCRLMIERSGALIDCQMATSHLGSLGARLLRRRDFVALLEQHVDIPAARWPFAPAGEESEQVLTSAFALR